MEGVKKWYSPYLRDISPHGVKTIDARHQCENGTSSSVDSVCPAVQSLNIKKPYTSPVQAKTNCDCVSNVNEHSVISTQVETSTANGLRSEIEV